MPSGSEGVFAATTRSTRKSSRLSSSTPQPSTNGAGGNEVRSDPLLTRAAESPSKTPTNGIIPISSPITPRKNNGIGASGGVVNGNHHYSPSKLLSPARNGATGNGTVAPLTDTAVKDLQTMTPNAPPAIQDAFQKLMQKAKQSPPRGANVSKDDGNSNGVAKTRSSSNQGSARGTPAAPASTAGTDQEGDSKVKDAASAVKKEQIQPEGQVEQRIVAPPNLATEILPAPPCLPQDAQYAPLNPDLTGFVPGLAYALAHPPVPTSGNGVKPANTNGTSVTSGTGHEIVSQGVGTNATSTTTDKKKKSQPTYSLASPDWYDGRVPFALYAIVNKRPEAVASPSQGKSKKRRKATAQAKVIEGLKSRSSTPGVNTLLQSDVDGNLTRAQSVMSTDAASDGGMTPRTQAAILSDVNGVEMTSSDIGSLQQTSDTFGQNDTMTKHPSTSQDGTVKTEVALQETMPLVDDDQEEPQSTIESNQTTAEIDEPQDSPTLGPAVTTSNDAGRIYPQASEDSSRDQDATALGGAADQATAAAAAEGEEEGSAESSVEQGSVIQPDLQLSTTDSSMATDTATSSSQQVTTDTDLSEQVTSSQAPSKHPASTAASSIDAAVSNNDKSRAKIVKRDSAKTMASEDTSPAPSALSAEVGGDESFAGDASFASTDASSVTPARPTRRAAAKVAAKGSYYSPSAFVLQAPQQAAQVHSIAATNVSARTDAGGSSSRSGSAGVGGTSRKGTNNNTPVNGTVSTVSTSDSSLNPAQASSSEIDFTDTKGKGKSTDTAAPAGDEGQYNNDFCSTCGGAGHFICCDSCPRSFHFACVDPPLDINEVPLNDDSAWYCRECTVARHPLPKPTQRDGLFGPLIHHLDQQNPSIFGLTPDIKNFFKGVATHADGSYVDANFTRQIKLDKKGLIEHRDPFKLRDTKGKEVLCYQCGGSALPQNRGEAEALESIRVEEGLLLQAKQGKKSSPSKRRSRRRSSGHTQLDAVVQEDEQQLTLTVNEEDYIRESLAWRRLVSCDFCTLHWHLDCLDPPLSNMPSNFRKWKCPCHIEELLVHTRIPKSSTQLQVVDLPIPTLQNTGYGPKQFYRPRVLNSGEIEIIPDPLDNFSSSSQQASSSSSFGKSILPGWQNVDLPSGDAEIPGGGIRRIRFRVPEKIVRTDWWMKVLQGGRDRLLDVNAPFKWVEQQRQQSKTGLDFLVEAALSNTELFNDDHDGIFNQDQKTSEDLIRLILNAASPASMRLQPPSLHEKPEQVAGHVKHQGGKLNREEDEALPESAMRSSIEDVNGTSAGRTPSKRTRSEQQQSHSEPTDPASPEPMTKKTKLTSSTNGLGEDELESLRAVRELIRRKGEDNLLAFLRS
ncbi:unnamed protein product [Sympodiomycopsis kandeliae]